jgi:Na+-driven multidrug efflux pump
MTGQRRSTLTEIVEDVAYIKHEPQLLHQHNHHHDAGRTSPSSTISGTTTSPLSYKTEVQMFFELAATTTLLNLGFVLSPLLTASKIGRRFGPVFLSGFSLANLTGNLCTFSLVAGLFSASDTLCPQAFGAEDYPEVGYLCIRGIIASAVMLIPINLVLILYLQPILIHFGQNPTAATLAQEWYQIFVLSIPFSIVYNTMWKFLSAQHVMKPLIVSSTLSCFIVLPLALELCTYQFGFLGSAIAYVIFQASEATLLLGYVIWKKPHHPETWPELDMSSVRQAMKMKPMLEYLHLGAGTYTACNNVVIYSLSIFTTVFRVILNADHHFFFCIFFFICLLL